jgi:hypothetical protein
MNLDKDFAIQIILITRELHQRFRRSDGSEKAMTEDEVLAYLQNIRFIHKQAIWLENYMDEQIAKQKQEKNESNTGGSSD